MFRWIPRFGLFVTLVATCPLNAQIGPTVLSLSGSAAPSGGDYSSFNTPTVNDFGQVAFLANLTGGTSTAGVFLGGVGTLQAVALQGESTPAGGTYNTFFTVTPRISNSGHAAFYATLTGASGSDAIFRADAGGTSVVALRGTPAPAGGNYNGFGAVPAINHAGQVALFSFLTGASSTRGLFVGTPGSMQAVALQGTAAPAGGTYQAFTSPQLGGNGHVAFRASLSDGTATDGIFVGQPGSVQAVVLQGSSAPGGGNFGSLNTTAFTVNDAGRVSFLAPLTGGSATSGLFVGIPGTVEAVALLGAAAPGGGNYSGLTGLAQNNAGQVAFAASLSGPSESGLFGGMPGAIQSLLRQGDAAPDGGAFDSFSTPVLNDFGDLAFAGTLFGTGVTAANDRGLFAGRDGSYVKVVREGDQVDVDPGAGIDLRTIADGGIGFFGATGAGSGFTNNGYLAYRLLFTDGSSGIFISQVPEPSTLLLVPVAALLVGRFRRKGRD